MLRYSFPFLCLFAVVVSCKNDRPGSTPDQSGALVGNTGIAQVVKPLYAENFTLDYYQGFKVLKVFNAWTDSKDTFTYVLYPRGTARPGGFNDAVFIETPVTRIVCLSTTHMSMLEFTDNVNQIAGVSNLKWVYSDPVRKKAADGSIVEVGDGPSLNYEKIVTLKPDLVLAFGMGDKNDVYPKLAQLGLPVVLTAEYMEETPLGRAEWVRFVAEFTGHDLLARQRYLEMAADYESLQKMHMTTDTKPRVLVGLPAKGTWYLPGGRSFIAKYIEHAGGDYPWEWSEKSGSISQSFEAVYTKAQEVNIWVDVVTARTLEDIKRTDKRLAELPVYKEEEIFTYNKRISAGGGYDIFESGVVYPNRVLRDFIKMLHFEDYPEIDLYYYQRLGHPTDPR